MEMIREAFYRLYVKEVISMLNRSELLRLQAAKGLSDTILAT